MPYASTADYNVQIVDNSGVPIVTFGGGTQYADGTAAATPTGTQVNFNEGGTQRSVSLTKPLPVQGILGNNAAAPGTTNVGALGGLANAADPSWTEGRQVLASMTLAGYQRTVVQGSVAAGGTPANPISMGFLGTGTTLRNLTAANSVTATSGNDIPGVGLMINDPVTGGGNGTWSRMRDANSADNSGGTGVLGAGELGWDGAAWRRAGITTLGVRHVGGGVAHDAADTGNPIKMGAKALELGTNPTGVSANDRTDLYALRAGVLFVMGGHPNIITRTDNYTAAQTDTAIVTVAAGTRIVVTAITIAADRANSVNVTARVGFGTASTPAASAAGNVIQHPGIDPGGGISRGAGSGILGIGADNEDLRITATVPTGGSITCTTTYFTMEST